jgi:hypothetical protein
MINSGEGKPGIEALPFKGTLHGASDLLPLLLIIGNGKDGGSCTADGTTVGTAL